MNLSAAPSRSHEPSLRWLVLLPLCAVWTFVPGLSPTWTLFAVSLSIFAVVKCESTLHFLATTQARPTARELIAWLFLWVGLDPAAFFTRRTATGPRNSEWFWGVSKLLLGLGLLFIAAPRCLALNELLAGWVAMIGLVFALHFGAFHLLALAWRRAGRDVVPIMRAPILATSLSEFWSRRWNLAFRDFAHMFVFRPLVRRRRVRLADWGAFAFSGLVHELAISVPAGAGYGLPLAYFLLQGCGVWLERRLPLAKHSGWGWCYTFLFTTPAAYWLFHPAFVRRLILPLIGG
ncbi:MAG: MBOAT family protein [Pirellulales bacterium]